MEIDIQKILELNGSKKRDIPFLILSEIENNLDRIVYSIINNPGTNNAFYRENDSSGNNKKVFVSKLIDENYNYLLFGIDKNKSQIDILKNIVDYVTTSKMLDSKSGIELILGSNNYKNLEDLKENNLETLSIENINFPNNKKGNIYLVKPEEIINLNKYNIIKEDFTGVINKVKPEKDIKSYILLNGFDNNFYKIIFEKNNKKFLINNENIKDYKISIYETSTF